MAWGLTKASCRMIEMFTGRGLKMFTRGEGMYTGRSLIYYQKPNDTALSIGKQAPIPNQTAVMKPTIKTKLAIGRRNGF